MSIDMAGGIISIVYFSDTVPYYLFVGTRSGLVQAYSPESLQPMSSALPVSSFAIVNLATVQYEEKHIFLIISLATGQVMLYRSLLPNV